MSSGFTAAAWRRPRRSARDVAVLARDAPHWTKLLCFRWHVGRRRGVSRLLLHLHWSARGDRRKPIEAANRSSASASLSRRSAYCVSRALSASRNCDCANRRARQAKASLAPVRLYGRAVRLRVSRPSVSRVSSTRMLVAETGRTLRPVPPRRNATLHQRTVTEDSHGLATSTRTLSG
jgi:hypothetical protein